MAVDDGMEGGSDPGGVPGGGPPFKTGNFDGDGDGDAAQPGTVAPHGTGADYGGSPGGGGDVSPPAGSGTGGQPRPEDFL